MTLSEKKIELIKLMEQKHGKSYTFGWLKMSYCAPSSTEELELWVIESTTEYLESLPDYEETQ